MKFIYPIKTEEQKNQDNIWFEETIRRLESGIVGSDSINHSGIHIQIPYWMQ